MKITRCLAIISVLAYFSITHCPLVEFKPEEVFKPETKPERFKEELNKDPMKFLDALNGHIDANIRTLSSEQLNRVSDMMLDSVRMMPDSTLKAESIKKGLDIISKITDPAKKAQKIITGLDIVADMPIATSKTIFEKGLDALTKNNLLAQPSINFSPTSVTRLSEALPKLAEAYVKDRNPNAINTLVKVANRISDAMPKESFTQKDKAAQFAENIIKTISNAALRATFVQGQAEFLKNIVSLAGKATHDYRDAQGNISSGKTNEHLANVVKFLQTVHDFQIGTNDPYGTIKDALLEAIDSSNILTNLKNLKGDARLQLKSNQIQLLSTLIKSKKISIDANVITKLYEQVLSPESQKLDTTENDRAITAFLKESLKEELQLDKKEEGRYELTKKELADALKTGNYQAKLKEAADIMAYRRAELTTKTPDELRQMTGKDLVNYWEDWKLILQNPYMNPTDNINAINQVLDRMSANYQDKVTRENLNIISRNLLRYALENKMSSDVMQKVIDHTLTRRTPDELRQMADKELLNYWEDWKSVLLSKNTNPIDNINAVSRVLLHMNEKYYEGVTPENLNAYFAMSRNLLRYAIENKVPSDVMEKALAPITWLIGPGGALAQPLLINNITLKKPASGEKAQENRATILSREYIQTLNMLSGILGSDAFKKTNSKSRDAVLALQKDALDRLSDTNFRTTIFNDPLVTDAMRSTIFKSALEMAAFAEKAGGQKLSNVIDTLQKMLPQSLDKETDQLYAFTFLDGLEKAAIDPQQKQQLNQTRIDLIKALTGSKLEGLSADQKNIVMTTIRNMVKNNIPGAAEVAAISTDMLIKLLQNHTQELTKPLLDFINKTISKSNPTSAELSRVAKTFAALANNNAMPFDNPWFSKLAESPAMAEVFQNTEPEFLIEEINRLKPATRDTLIRNLNQSLTIRGNDQSQRKDVIQLLDQILYIARNANQVKNYNESITWYTLALSHLSNENVMTELLNAPMGNKPIDPSGFSKGIDALIRDLLSNKATIDPQNIQNLAQNLINFASTIKIEQRSKSKQESTTKENITHALSSALMLTKNSKLFEPIKEKMLDASLNGMTKGIFNDKGQLMLQEMYRTPLKASARYEQLGIFEHNILSFLQNGIMFESNHLMNAKNELIKIRSMLDDNQKITTKGSESDTEASDEVIKKTKQIINNDLDSLIARLDLWDAFNKKDYSLVVKHAEQAFTEFPIQGEKGYRVSFAHDFIKRILPELTPNLSEKDATKLLKVLADPAAIDQLSEDYVELMTSNSVADLIKKSNGHDALGVLIDLNEKGIDKSSLSSEAKKQILDFWNKALFPHGESSIFSFIKGFLKP